MAYIDLVAEEDADELLEKIYAAARQRAGGVANIIKLMSRDPATLAGSMELYLNFNYINRIADGLGVDAEDWMTPSPEEWKAQKGTGFERTDAGSR